MFSMLMQKSKMAIWGGLTNSCEKKRSEKQRRKGKIYPLECRVPKNSSGSDKQIQRIRFDRKSALRTMDGGS